VPWAQEPANNRLKLTSASWQDGTRSQLKRVLSGRQRGTAVTGCGPGSTMMPRWGLLSVILAVIAFAPAGCGGNNPAGPGSDEDFPRIVSNCADGPPSAIYFISGLSSRVVNPSAPPPLEARVRVGETVKLQLNLQGCGFHVDESWISTNPTAGQVDREAQYSFRADLRAVSPGQLSIFVEFRAPDGRRHRTTTGYCSLDAQYPGLPGLGVCGNPTRIGVVTVVP
jgi:hypothetical protein